jgi:hypothetical protein
VRKAHQMGAFVTPAHVAAYVVGDLVINVIIAGLLS